MLRRMPNSVYLKIYQDHFLLGYPLAEVAEKLDAAWHLLDSIDSRAVHAWLDRWNAGDLNRIYAVQGNNPDYPFPDSETLTRLPRSPAILAGTLRAGCCRYAAVPDGFHSCCRPHCQDQKAERSRCGGMDPEQRRQGLLQTQRL